MTSPALKRIVLDINAADVVPNVSLPKINSSMFVFMRVINDVDKPPELREAPMYAPAAADDPYLVTS